MAFSQRWIVLVGMMGAGKTSVGRLLAARIGLPFHDSDEAIEAASGRTVAELFEQEGEAGFRARERQAVAALLHGPPAVIATGGGAMLDAGTRALLKERAWTVWLDADPVELARRLAGSTNRPLLRTGDPAAVLRRLSSERRPFYAAADLQIVSDAAPPGELARRIEAALQTL